MEQTRSIIMEPVIKKKKKTQLWNYNNNKVKPNTVTRHVSKPAQKHDINSLSGHKSEKKRQDH